MKLDGAAAVVTGGASGLGGATARELASAGAKVTVFDLNEDLGNKMAEEIGGAFVKCNVADEDSTVAAFKAASETHGPCRILINCAGIGAATKATSKGEPHPLDVFKRVIDVNLIGTFNCIRLGATEMAAGEPDDNGDRGVIVNTASVAAFDGQIGQAAYSASKGGIVGMTLPIARDLMNDGIRVLHHRTGPVHDPAAGRSAGQCEGCAGCLRAVSEASRRSVGIRDHGPPHCREPDAER